MYCAPGGGHIECNLESDGGRITLEPVSGGRLRVEAPKGMGFETERGFLDLARSDDTTFVLNRLPAAQCRRPGR